MDPDASLRTVRATNYVTWRKQGGWAPLLVTRAEGSTFWDSAGRAYLDFASQLVATNLGHGNRAVIDAIVRQANTLPFAAPDDPVLEARLSALRESGGNPFFDWQIPAAVIALKQGAGRLIRDVGDRGVLMLCDPRLTTRAYGKLFLKSLPPLPITREVDDVQKFFGAAEAAVAMSDAAHE